MIEKREIIDFSNVYKIHPHMVDKDYVLGWLLWGIGNCEKIQHSWLFKGGTCLKKCHFETFRFSEDLDFTLLDPSHIDESFLRTVFSEIGLRINERTGINFPVEFQKFDIYENPRGNLSCQVRIGYQGPVSPVGRSTPRVNIDLTADELVVMSPNQLKVVHQYSDFPDEGIFVLSYAYLEAFGEKIRALTERSRPRDLYDIINLYRNDEARPLATDLLHIVQQKCEFKGIGLPELIELNSKYSTMSGNWETMLAHQMPKVPLLSNFWDMLPEFLQWLKSDTKTIESGIFGIEADEQIIRDRTIHLPIPVKFQVHLELIRFAASNRLCVDMDFQQSTHRIEPYSLRRSGEGKFILYAHNIDENKLSRYPVNEIKGATATDQVFRPRYKIELIPAG